jgi:hypothetical protein
MTTTTTAMQTAALAEGRAALYDSLAAVCEGLEALHAGARLTPHELAAARRRHVARLTRRAARLFDAAHGARVAPDVLRAHVEAMREFWRILRALCALGGQPADREVAR